MLHFLASLKSYSRNHALNKLVWAKLFPRVAFVATASKVLLMKTVSWWWHLRKLVRRYMILAPQNTRSQTFSSFQDSRKQVTGPEWRAVQKINRLKTFTPATVLSLKIGNETTFC